MCCMSLTENSHIISHFSEILCVLHEINSNSYMKFAVFTLCNLRYTSVFHVYSSVFHHGFTCEIILSYNYVELEHFTCMHCAENSEKPFSHVELKQPAKHRN